MSLYLNGRVADAGLLKAGVQFIGLRGRGV